jgi:hypothetical protein
MSGLLMVLSDPPEGSEQPFNDWYDQHAAARLSVPGITTGQRYRALVGEPQYMASYDLDSPEVLESPPYLDLRANRPPGEQEMIDSLPAELDRRIYVGLEEFVNEGFAVEASTHAVAVWMSVDDPEDFAAWYAQEHVPLLFAVPGWLRCRRFQLVAGAGPEFLALHDLASFDAVDDPRGAPARNTEWRDRVISYRTAYERRVYSLLKRY